MPRKYVSTSRFLKPDPQFGNKTLAKFINTVMYDGKKSIAMSMVYRSLEQLKKRFPEESPVTVFETAVNNVKPQLEVKSKRVGGANYQVPVEVRPHRAQYLAFTWIIEAARGRKGKPFVECLTEELSEAFKKEGAAVRKREETHRMADANRAFAHFAW